MTTFYSNPKDGQDRWVVERVLPGKRGGYFVEAGAAPLSNTLALETHYGWTGIAVEPHPDAFEDVKRERRCITEQVCLSDAATEVEFVINKNVPWASGIRGTVGDDIQRAHYGEGAETETVRISGVPLWELLRRHNAPKRVDYLSLDIEGAEWIALKDFPFGEYSFNCMTIERGSRDYHRLRAKLLREGYRLVRIGRADDSWVHPDVPYEVPFKDRLNVAFRRVVQPLKRWLTSRRSS